MNKRFLTILILLLVGLGSVRAQRIHAYVNGGLVGAQVEGDELKGFNHWALTGGVGAIANLDDNDTWNLSLEADYSCRGIYEGTRSTGTPYNIKLDLHYVDIPLTLFYHDPIGGLRIGLGMTYGRLVSQPHGIVRYNPDLIIVDSTDMSFLKNDLSPTIEFRFALWKGLQFSARYQFSVIKVKENWHFKAAPDFFKDKKTDHYNDCYNQSLQFRLLWQFGDSDSRNGSHHKSYKKKRRY